MTVSRDELAAQVWPHSQGNVSDAQIDKVISLLRAVDPALRLSIVTVKGRGYLLDGDLVSTTCERAVPSTAEVDTLPVDRYHDLAAIFADRTSFDREISYARLFDSAKTIDAIGISLNAITINFGSAQLSKLLQDNQCVIRLLFLDPECDEVVRRELYEGYSPGTLAQLTRANIQIIVRVMSDHPSLARDGSIQYKLYSRPPWLSAYFIDSSVAVIQFYRPENRGLENPCFFVRRTTHSDLLYSSYYSAFEEAWRDEHEDTFAISAE